VGSLLSSRPGPRRTGLEPGGTAIVGAIVDGLSQRGFVAGAGRLSCRTDTRVLSGEGVSRGIVTCSWAGGADGKNIRFAAPERRGGCNEHPLGRVGSPAHRRRQAAAVAAPSRAGVGHGMAGRVLLPAIVGRFV